MKLKHMLISLITMYILLFITITTLYFTHTQKKVVMKNLEDQVTTLIKMMSISTSTQIFWSNYDKLNQYAQKIKERMDVKYVMIIDKSGKIIAHTDRTKIGQEISSQRDFNVLESLDTLKKYNYQESTFTLSHPIFVIDEVVGYVILQHSMGQIEKEIDRISQKGFWLATILGLIGVLFAVSSASKITQPIKLAMEGMDRIRGEDYDFKIIMKSGAEEFKTLARAFNSMGSKLKYTIQRLDKERRQSEAIITSITDGLMIIDTDHMIRFFNKGAENILEYKAEEAVGKKCTEIIKSPQCLDENCSLFRKNNGEGTDCGKTTDAFFNERISLVSKQGKNLVILKSTAPLIDSSGDLYGGVEVFKDITSLLAMENKLKESDRLSSVGVLASGVAHEVNNPLTGIIGLAKGLLKIYKDDPLLNEDLTMIKEQGERCGKIINNLMNLSTEAPKQVAPLEINALLHGIVRIMTKTTPNIKMSIGEDYDSVNPIVKGDETQIVQVFTNIIRNAITATKGEGRLHVSTKLVNSKVKISFRDNGEGITQENLSRVCDPFFTTKKVGKGMGLGLAVSYGIIRNHGGELKVESDFGKGACFTIFFSSTSAKESPYKSVLEATRDKKHLQKV